MGLIVSLRRWCSGIMLGSHSCEPGSIPGRCVLNFFKTRLAISVLRRQRLFLVDILHLMVACTECLKIDAIHDTDLLLRQAQWQSFGASPTKMYPLSERHFSCYHISFLFLLLMNCMYFKSVLIDFVFK